MLAVHRGTVTLGVGRPRPYLMAGGSAPPPPPPPPASAAYFAGDYFTGAYFAPTYWPGASAVTVTPPAALATEGGAALTTETAVPLTPG